MNDTDKKPAVRGMLESMVAIDECGFIPSAPHTTSEEATRKIMNSSFAGVIDKPLRGGNSQAIHADVAGLPQDELDIKKMEKELLTDMRSNFGDMGRTLISSRMELGEAFQASAQEGGPSTTAGALLHLLEVSNVGMRTLSRKVGVGRKPLLGMLHGRTEMPPEVFNKIYAVIDKANPKVFA